MVSIRTNVDPRQPGGPGRPRGFSPEQALAGALELFWHQGYEATSLDDLMRSMGLSKSSLYACYGSKHGVLMAALQQYTDDFIASVTPLTASEPDPLRAIDQVLERMADVRGGSRGCFFINAVVELAPHEPALAEFARGHLARIEALIARLLRQSGLARRPARERASAAMALVMGTVMLRKAGVPRARLQAMLDQVQLLTRAPID
ncbi:TetR/AcrR family transcriptional regulator [Dyella sp.]|uniref:TetR/AcrR family transcriptional regulator n=1 Tax=Dyella sp. TaxID=1869338 RepID=UPI002D785CD8|nr:TetR/AcrR family transcriptional regulator [Dyella sp.]HET6433578.1 TetR/AcrR family transcriptional regulator [Dyella sp.]